MNEFEKLILSNLNDIKSDLNQVKTEMSVVKSDLSEVKTELKEVKTQVNTLNSKLDTVIEQTVKNTEHNTIVTQNKEDIRKLKFEVDLIKNHLKI